jgi:hypothetical protein
MSSNPLIGASGQELVASHNEGNASALPELQRRYAVNGRLTTKRMIEKCGSSVNTTTS